MLGLSLSVLHVEVGCVRQQLGEARSGHGRLGRRLVRLVRLGLCLVHVVEHG